jgi:hypothetical protein
MKEDNGWFALNWLLAVVALSATAWYGEWIALLVIVAVITALAPFLWQQNEQP